MSQVHWTTNANWRFVA